MKRCTFRPFPAGSPLTERPGTRQLRQLPGVGELLAQRIIAARPFKRVADLQAVKGMTPEHYRRLERYFNAYAVVAADDAVVTVGHWQR